jgi:hypothetical protein
MRYLILGTVLAALGTAPAAAETFKLGDLGPVSSRGACMTTAQKVLDAYLDEFGGHSTAGDPADPAAWQYSAWDLRPGDSDVVISCPVVAGQVNAFFAIHSSGPADAADAEEVAGRLRVLWERFY